MNVQEHVQQVGKLMVSILVKSMRAGKISLKRAQEIARFYLYKLKTVQSEEDLKKELEVMEAAIPEMKSVVDLEKAKLKEAHEQALRQKADELLKQGKIAEAAELAKQIK